MIDFTTYPDRDTPGYVDYLENNLEVAILEHTALNAIAIETQLAYMEDGETKEASDGILSKIKKTIFTILDKIGALIEGFIDSVKSLSKNRLTASKYMNSETAKYRLNCDVTKMMEAVDKEYLKTRKVVQAISKGTGVDPAEVANIADTVNETIHNPVVIAMGKAIVTDVVASNIRAKLVRAMDKGKGTKEEIARLTQRLTPESPDKAMLSKHYQKKVAKHGLNDKDARNYERQLKVLTGASKALHAVMNAYVFLGAQIVPAK